MRSLQEWIVFYNPLTSQPGRFNYAKDAATEVSADTRLELPFDTAIYSQLCAMAVSRQVGPDGLMPADYLAAMCDAKGFGELAAKLRGQEIADYRTFRLIDCDKLTVTLEDAVGTRYSVDKNSFGKATDFKIAKGFALSLVKYGDIWQQNGMAIVIPQNPFKEENTVPGFSKSKKGNELAAEISARHRGRRVFFCKDTKELSRLLGIPCRTEADVEAEPGDLLVLLSDIEGIVTLSGYACVVKDRTNPLYDKAEAEACSLELVASGLVPDDIAAIFQEKKMLPAAALDCHQGKRFGRRVMQENLRYFFAFYRSCRL